MLNKVLGPPTHQAATAEVTEVVVTLAAEVLARLTAGVLSLSTLGCLTQRMGQTIQKKTEAEEVERVFGQDAALQQQGERVAPRLFIQATGVMVRQGRTVWREVRVGLAYDDEGVGQDGFHIVGGLSGGGGGAWGCLEHRPASPGKGSRWRHSGPRVPVPDE